MKQRRVLIFLLAVLIVCTTALFVSAESQTTAIPYQRYVNPLYADVVTQPLLQSSGSRAVVDSYCDSLDTAAEVLRTGLEAREAEITVGYATTDSYNENWSRMIFEKALEHTGVSTQGDYLRWQFKQYRVGGSRYSQSGVNYITLTYAVDYLSTAQQEQQMDAAVASLLAQLDVNDASNYRKVCAVYDYICQNITYDYDAVETFNPTAHTAYAALINKSAVCQGYANLFYRLMLELDVDTRLVAGFGNGGDHAWNIVKLSDLYYNVDATWDAGRQDYQYFLKCDANFDDHLRSDEYATETFYSQYPMAPVDYDPSQDTGDDSVIGSGTCGENLTWILDNTGTLTVSGTGSMYDYSYSSSSPTGSNHPWKNVASSIKSVVIADGVTSIGDFAFYNCVSLASVTIPDSVTSIGNSAFEDCDSLASVTIPDSVTSIGDFAFYYCYLLASVTIPDSVTSIGDSAFYNCASLASVTIPDSVTSIGNSAFSYCDSLASVTIPDSVTIIGDSAFNDCERLTGIWVDADNANYSSDSRGVLFNKDQTTLIQAPGAIAGSYRIPDSVTSIGYAALRGCSSLENVTIGNSVTSIGSYAFYNCHALTDVYFGGTQAQWESIDIGSSNYKLTGARIHYNHIHDFTVIPSTTVDPTCTQDGYTVYTCIWGETHIDNYVPALGHAYSGPVVTVEPTCTEDGYTGNRCTRCGDIEKKNIIDAFGHNIVVIPASDPTCDKPGLTVGTACQRCGLVVIEQTESAPALGHSFTSYISDNNATYDADGTKTAKCDRCDATDTVADPGTKIPAKNGWQSEGGKWYFYENGTMVKNAWILDGSKWYFLDGNGCMASNQWCKASGGWCWMTASGAMAANQWIHDGKGWCYIGADGYCQTNCWIKDSVGWMWLDGSGYMATNAWILDGSKWYFLDSNGCMASNQWCKASGGWCWMTASGAMAANQWIHDGKGWCYIGADGYCRTNCWIKDAVGWMWLDGSGYMATNAWIQNGGNWYFMNSKGYMMSNAWMKDANGWMWLGSDGAMAANAWVYNGGCWYWMNGSGYMVSNTSVRIGGKIYNFNASGICTNP